MEALQVNEIFYSIQGESSFAGRPCVFVRLTGCNLRCTWCDTAYAFHEGRRMGLDEILRAVEAHPARLVELTGGEPLLQPDALPLMRQLADRGWTVLLETGGSLELTGVDPRVVRIVDVKCPGSGESERNLWSNLAGLRATDEVKFVLVDRADFDFAGQVLDQRLGGFEGTVHFSPVWGRLEPVTLAGWILESGRAVKLQLQLHKLLWPAETRGV